MDGTAIQSRTESRPPVSGTGLGGFVAMVITTFFFATGCQTKQPPVLRPFQSDGCSAFPDGTCKEPTLWQEDCVLHDYAYWKGGTREERRQADRKLRDGVERKGKPVVAALMYVGVRVGGMPWWPTPWRWGFGWQEFPRGYRALTEEERRRVEESGKPPLPVGPDRGTK